VSNKREIVYGSLDVSTENRQVSRQMFTLNLARQPGRWGGGGQRDGANYLNLNFPIYNRPPPLVSAFLQLHCAAHRSWKYLNAKRRSFFLATAKQIWMRNLFGGTHPRAGHDNADDDFVGLAKKQNHKRQSNYVEGRGERVLHQVMQVQGQKLCINYNYFCIC